MDTIKTMGIIVKHLFVLVLLSIVLLLFANETSYLLEALEAAHDVVSGQLGKVFSSSYMGTMIKEIISLVIVPFALSAIPAVIYYAIKRQLMPYYYHLLWLLWVILAVMLTNQA